MHNKSKVWQIIHFSLAIFFDVRCTCIFFFLFLSPFLSIGLNVSFWTIITPIVTYYRTFVEHIIFCGCCETDMHWLYIFIKIFHTNSARKLKLVWITSNVNYGVCVCAVCFDLNGITFHATIHRQSIYN